MPTVPMATPAQRRFSLHDKPEASVVLWHSFVELIRRCGEFSDSTSKSTVTFKGVRQGVHLAR